MAGVLLLVASVVAAVVVTLAAVALWLNLIVFADPYQSRGILVEAASALWFLLPYLYLAAAPVILCWGAGAALGRGDRRLVLFLRRFGFGPATAALTFALKRSIGRSSRAITLDDEQVAPVSVRGPLRWLAGLGLVLCLAALLWMGYLTGQFLDEAIATVAGTDPNLVPLNSMQQLIPIVLLALVLGGLVPTAVLLSLGVAMIRRAHRARVVRVARAEEVEDAVATVRSRAEKLVAPRLAVLRVHTDLWKEAVVRLLGAAHVVVVDVSVPSRNLLWEMRTLRSHAVPFVPVVARGQLADLKAGSAPPASEMRELLRGDQVYVYEPDRLGPFTVVLRDALRSSGNRPRPAPAVTAGATNRARHQAVYPCTGSSPGRQPSSNSPPALNPTPKAR